MNFGSIKNVIHKLFTYKACVQMGFGTKNPYKGWYDI